MSTSEYLAWSVVAAWLAYFAGAALVARRGAGPDRLRPTEGVAVALLLLLPVAAVAVTVLGREAGGS